MPDNIQKIGKYEIVSELGRGAMGIVYKGLDPVINRYVAIKTLARYAAETDGTQLAERFKHEAQAAGRLNHPNIVSVYEYGEEQNRAFIAMEFVDGCTVADLAKRGEILGIGNTWNIMRKVLDALQYAHAKGVVHRDIKPSNIMCTSAGDVKIADFGIARIESSGLTQVGTVLGTPGYMSPEQLLGQRVDHRSDIFSAGILLFELLTGERAFDGTNITSTIYKVVHTELPPASKLCPTIPEAVDAVLARALAKNPDERFQTAKEFADAIENIARNHGQTEATMISRPPCGDETIIPRTSPQTSPQASDLLNSFGSGTATASRHPTNTITDPSRETVVQLPGRPNTPGNVKKWLLAILGVAVIGGAITAIMILNPAQVGIKREETSTSQPSPLPKVDESTHTLPYTEQKSRTTQLANLPGSTFMDCETCPRMVVIPSGSFMQGSPVTEIDREQNEGPQHAVNIPYSLAVGQFEVTRGEFARFVSESGYESSGCWIYDGTWSIKNGHNWLSPGFPQEDNHPVTCVSWEDAKAYVGWLNEKTGKNYRLLSSSEWEYVARSGTESSRSWGDDAVSACQSANVADLSTEKLYPGWDVFSCSDGYNYTAPAGSFLPNGFGVYDMLGNVFEWVDDCWNDGYHGAPNDGSAWTSGDCTYRMLRGGSWFSEPKFVRSAFRNRFEPDYRSSTFGFRVARTVGPD